MRCVLAKDGGLTHTYIDRYTLLPSRKLQRCANILETVSLRKYHPLEQQKFSFIFEIGGNITELLAPNVNIVRKEVKRREKRSDN